ncbi:MAG: InlB B-repeat-containing protein, partial [Clostridia bacterium]|nr:InlB B-repeat-containing protein [Clostridia bacterium]
MKNSKIFKTLIVISILLCAVVVMFACTPADIGGGDPSGGSGTGNGGGDNTPTDTTITITFMDGDEVIKESTMPKDAIDYVPEKEGFVFVGWYLDEDLTEENE